MLQRLESIYLNILRTVVILFSGILLVCVIAFGINSIKGLSSAPEDEAFTPEISTKELISAITQPAAGDMQKEVTPTAPENNQDKNQQYYEDTAKSIVEFSAKYGEPGLDISYIAGILKRKAEAYESDETKRSFAVQLTAAFKEMFSDPTVIQYVQQGSPTQFVDQSLEGFVAQFNQQLSTNEVANEVRQQQHLLDQAEALQSLYMAAAAFGLFLLIVFMSIFIKIERNLRNLQPAQSTM